MNATNHKSRLFSPVLSIIWGLPREGIALCTLVLVNLGLILISNQVPGLGRDLLKLSDVTLTGIGFGLVAMTIFLMSFGHFRSPMRQLICSGGIVVIVGVWQLIWGGSMETIAMSQLFSIGALWLSYAVLVSFRVLFRLEFGFPIAGYLLPARTIQFRLKNLMWFGGIIAIACAFIRLWLSLAEESNTFRNFVLADLLWAIGFPLGMLLFTIPLLITSLRNHRSYRSWIWLAFAIGWGCVPGGLAVMTTPVDVVILYASFWLTLVINFICFRLIGFRWLPAAKGF